MAKQKTGDKNPVGRPVSDRGDNDKAKSYTVSITPNENAAICKKFGNRSAALKHLYNSIKKTK